jgi:hypothetical protein
VQPDPNASPSKLIFDLASPSHGPRLKTLSAVVTADRQLKDILSVAQLVAGAILAFVFLKRYNVFALWLDVDHRMDEYETRFLFQCRNLAARRCGVANPWKD